MTWRRLDGFGWERLELRGDAGGIVARSVALTDAWAAAWTIRLAPDWTFRSLLLRRTDGAVLRLRRGAGWVVNGRDAPGLAACVDIDLGGSPFTNTLPIRRRPEGGRFTMAWIDPEALTVVPDGQIYEPLGRGRWLYRAADRTFSAAIETDADGLVVRYPGLFEAETGGGAPSPDGRA